MSKKTRRPKTFADLHERAAGDELAQAALERYDRIKEKNNGMKPEIWYSDFDGWIIVDQLAKPNE